MYDKFLTLQEEKLKGRQEYTGKVLQSPSMKKGHVTTSKERKNLNQGCSCTENAMNVRVPTDTFNTKVSGDD